MGSKNFKENSPKPLPEAKDMSFWSERPSKYPEHRVPLLGESWRQKADSKKTGLKKGSGIRTASDSSTALQTGEDNSFKIQRQERFPYQDSLSATIKCEKRTKTLLRT